jgi:hypothetical protein
MKGCLGRVASFLPGLLVSTGLLISILFSAKKRTDINNPFNNPRLSVRLRKNSRPDTLLFDIDGDLDIRSVARD